ncbi:AP2 domain-containing protein [Fictibacillus sp. Mic-4]|uniref:HNH endonuclease n=1 Tax=Fictibacillus sp. Mic-4 TaxID=3132826 RepID=UPI003CF750E0
MPKRVDSKRIDLTGQQFGELTVVKLSDQRGTNNTLLWECKCSCGKIVYLQGYSLLHGHYKSCGCKQPIKRDKGVKKHIEQDKVDGTRKTALKAKLHKKNKSGHKGVMWMESRKKWKAYIGFKGKQINLGHFDEKEDAIAARKEAEEKYFKPILEENDEQSRN